MGVPNDAKGKGDLNESGSPESTDSPEKQDSPEKAILRIHRYSNSK